MRSLIRKVVDFKKIEFWALTTFFVFMLFFFIRDGVQGSSTINPTNKTFFEEAGAQFSFYRNYFFPQLVRLIILFLTFLMLNFVVIPNLVRKEAVPRNIFLVVVLFLLCAMVLCVTNIYLKSYLFSHYQNVLGAYIRIFQESFLYSTWLLLLLGFYSAIKYSGLYLLSCVEVLRKKYRFIDFNGLAALVLWMMGLFLLLIINEDNKQIAAVWGVVGLSGIFLYWYSFYLLIPNSLIKKRSILVYLGKVIFTLVVAFLPTTFLLMPLVILDDVAFSISLFNTIFQLFITAPLSWLLFKRKMRGNEEIYILKKKLRHSNASLDFLRSQINPHFLFNALNTIYGNALVERAVRTSEGIEKLGDMMRFMLQENMQEKISLARDVENLNNFISLQTLRTDLNANIQIQAEIEQQANSVEIAPMLLIPFIENAFKHGVSFRKPSYINIVLELKDNILYFEVHNSKHAKQESDSEKNKSGTGLGNVKLRLQLLYPDKHELAICETEKEFSIHLMIYLS
ncbi:sensor histidine kinase [Nafulsella turpanensis]|uniref:sensor histidine kinase n=1 Tax=Nafulsella turpanensis TaxID=1265690 RepID=UPI00034B8FA9|nr:histidine kinase [Nafulsella turpanensis]